MSGFARPPSAVKNFMPLFWYGMWDAVSMMDPFTSEPAGDTQVEEEGRWKGGGGMGECRSLLSCWCPYDGSLPWVRCRHAGVIQSSHYQRVKAAALHHQKPTAPGATMP